MKYDFLTVRIQTIFGSIFPLIWIKSDDRYLWLTRFRIVLTLSKLQVYINNILKAFKNAVPKLFADDTDIFIFHKTKHVLFKVVVSL